MFDGGIVATRISSAAFIGQLNLQFQCPNKFFYDPENILNFACFILLAKYIGGWLTFNLEKKIKWTCGTQKNTFLILHAGKTKIE